MKSSKPFYANDVIYVNVGCPSGFSGSLRALGSVFVGACPKITACAGGTTNEFYKYRMQFCIVSRRNVISQFNVTEKVSNILNISIVVLFYGLISKHAEHIHLCDNSQKHLLTMSSQKH